MGKYRFTRYKDLTPKGIEMNDERINEPVPTKEPSVHPLNELKLEDGTKVVKDKGGRWQVQNRPQDPKAGP